MIDENSQQDKEFITKIKKENQKLEKWEGKVQKALKTNPETSIMNILISTGGENADYADINKQLQKIENTFKPLISDFDENMSKYSDLASEFKAVEKIMNQVEWIRTAITAKRELEENGNPIEYRLLKKLVEQIDVLGFQRDIGLCQTLLNLYTRAQSVYREYEQTYAHAKNKVNITDPERYTVKKLSEKNRVKMTIKEAF